MHIHLANGLIIKLCALAHPRTTHTHIKSIKNPRAAANLHLTTHPKPEHVILVPHRKVSEIWKIAARMCFIYYNVNVVSMYVSCADDSVARAAPMTQLERAVFLK